MDPSKYSTSDHHRFPFSNGKFENPTICPFFLSFDRFSRSLSSDAIRIVHLKWTVRIRENHPNHLFHLHESSVRISGRFQEIRNVGATCLGSSFSWGRCCTQHKIPNYVLHHLYFTICCRTNTAIVDFIRSTRYNLNIMLYNRVQNTPPIHRCTPASLIWHAYQELNTKNLILLLLYSFRVPDLHILSSKNFWSQSSSCLLLGLMVMYWYLILVLISSAGFLLFHFDIVLFETSRTP
jgi:hypothetical protein